MPIINTLVILLVGSGAIWCFRIPLKKFYDWISSFNSSSSETDDDDTTTGINFE